MFVKYLFLVRSTKQDLSLNGPSDLQLIYGTLTLESFGNCFMCFCCKAQPVVNSVLFIGYRKENRKK